MATAARLAMNSKLSNGIGARIVATFGQYLVGRRCIWQILYVLGELE